MALTPPPVPVTDNTRLAALYEVSQALNSSLNLDEALVIVMDAAIGLTRAERGFLMLFDDETSELAFRVARSSKQETLFESGFEVRRVSLGAHWVDSRESSLLRRLERGREIGL